MNSTRYATGHRRAAVKAVWEQIHREDEAKRRQEAISAMSKIAAASVKPKLPKRDSRGRFIKVKKKV